MRKEWGKQEKRTRSKARNILSFGKLINCKGFSFILWFDLVCFGWNRSGLDAMWSQAQLEISTRKKWENRRKEWEMNEKWTRNKNRKKEDERNENDLQLMMGAKTESNMLLF